MISTHDIQTVKLCLMTVILLGALAGGTGTISQNLAKANEFESSKEFTSEPDGMALASSTNARTCAQKCYFGFICLEGNCVSRCNPPCPESTICTDDARCIDRKFEGNILVMLTRRDLQRAAQARRESAMNERFAYRLRPRLVLRSLIAFFCPMDVFMMGVSTAIGYRQNILSLFGVEVTLGALWGSDIHIPVTGNSDSNEDDNTAIGEYYAEIVPFFGPSLAHAVGFYFGPILWGSYRTLSNNNIIADSGKVYSLQDGWRLGGGLEVGALFLRHEQLDVKLRFKFNFNDLDDIPRLETGISYQFVL